jgi:hypothetical protein
LLILDLDNTGGGAPNAAVEINSTAAGVAAGVTYTVTNGIMALSGIGAGTVDTIGEWLAEAAAVAATAGDVLGFVFAGDTYVFAENGGADVLVQLTGVAATSLVEVTATTTATAGAVLFADIV